MSSKVRVVHYLNQFFGSLGGEDKAHVEPRSMEGPVGPGRAIQGVLGDRGEVVGSIICGDNFFSEKTEEALKRILPMAECFKPDLLMAGPAFNAGRYGVACGELCQAVQESLRIPAVTAMFKENPGVDLFRKHLYIIRTDENVKDMNQAVARMVNVGLRLVSKQRIGRPEEEGYYPRGIVVDELSEKNAAERAVDMVLAKISGKPIVPEIELPKFDRVSPASPVRDLSKATIALVTDGGLVLKGNPDGFEPRSASKLCILDVTGKMTLSKEEFEGHHSGYDTAYVNQDPNRLVPLDVMRILEREGVIGKLHNKIYATAGVAASLDNARRIGRLIVEQLRNENVAGVIQTSTWGTSTRCGAAIEKEIERAGIPSAQISTMTPVAIMVGSNRVIPGAGIVHPVGNPDVSPEAEKRLRRSIVEMALKALQTDLKEQKLFPRR